MLTLYYSPGACSLAAHIILNELQVPFDLKRVDLKTHQVDEQDYYKINPQGSVPLLRTTEDQYISQNIAILIYLAELNPKKNLIPPATSFERIRALEWLGFLTADVHKGFGPLFKLTSLISSADGQQELKENVEKNLLKNFKLLNDKLANTDYALGDDFSIVDSYFFVFYRWANFFKISLDGFPKLVNLGIKISERPSVIQALETEGLKK